MPVPLDAIAAELEKTAATLRSASEGGSGVPEGVPDALRAIADRLEGVREGSDGAAALRKRVAELEAEVARLAGPPFAGEVAEMLAAGSPPERYSGRSDREEGPEAFLRRVYGRYLAEGAESIYLNELRRLDEKLVWALTAACRKEGRAVSDVVPKRSEKTERALLAAGGEARAAELAKAATALRRRRDRAGK